MQETVWKLVVLAILLVFAVCNDIALDVPRSTTGSEVLQPRESRTGNHRVLRDTLQRNNVSSCNPTLLGDRRCIRYNGTFCKAILTEDNRTFISVNCSSTKENIEKSFVALIAKVKRQNYSATNKCIKGMKRVLCATYFPDCDEKNTLKKQLCREACELVKDSICNLKSEGSSELLSSNDEVFKCKSLPSERNTSTNCFFPAHLKDLPKKKEENHLFLIVIGASGGAVVLTIIICTIVCCKSGRRGVKSKPPREDNLNLDSVDASTGSLRPFSYSFNVDCTNENPLYSNQSDLMRELKLPNFSREKLVFIADLGEGAFGKVIQCEAHGMPDTGTRQKIITAVKYLKAEATDHMRANFMKEVQTLASFSHQNIVRILGICVDDNGPPCMVLEYMEHGDLAKFIRERAGTYHAGYRRNGALPDDLEFQAPALTFRHLLYIAKQIASGMAYLATRRFVHRDLATRNNLVGERMLVKIADFGLAQEMYSSDYYRINGEKLLPIRWLPPEALMLGKFTVQSDIWSFGVLVWELFTYGMQPYPGLGNDEVCERIRCFKLLPCPDGCPSEVYDLIRLCWKYQPEKRMPFSKIQETLGHWLDKRSPFIEAAWEKMLSPPKIERAPTLPEKKARAIFYR